MATKVSDATRQDLLQAIRERYRAGTKDDKVQILDEFIAVTGYHRKHVIRLFKAGPVTSGASRRPRLALYDEAVRETVVVLWEASDRVCGKRLKPLVPILVAALERHGHLTLASTVRARVLAASAATLDRLLTSTRAAVSGHRTRRRALPAVQRNVPVRTCADWDSPLPGDMEADLVSHGGESAAGSFVHTLTLTDVASGWTECVALVVRDGALVVAALEQMRTRMPFPLRGFDTDNGGEFMNETVAAYCREHGIPCTRSRPYHKNDQAWVEQKNGSVVRRLVGYRRLEGLAAAEALARLYAASRLFVNFFQPSFKLASKARVGAKVRKTYHAPETPCARLLGSAAIPDEMKTRLQAVALQLDPLQLLEEIRAVQHHLAELAAGHAAHLAPRHAGSLDLRTHLHRIFGVDLTTIPGIDVLTAHTLLTEVGPELSKFPTPAAFASWLGLCPDNRISGGKVLSVKTRRVKNRAALALRMSAQAVQGSHSALGGYYRRMRGKLGGPMAITATAHRLARVVYHLLASGQAYDESVFVRHEASHREHVQKRLQAQAAALGFRLVPATVVP